MKKILMLGGSMQQIPAIKKAKEMGYYVITCDYLENNPGHKFADEYYNVSTTDKYEVLKLAKKLNIDGIVCYASDPSSPTQAYVAEKMGLHGNPYKSVNILANKDLFRNFLKINNFATPYAKGYSEIEEAIRDLDNFKMPIIIKPVDSSGSKGISKITDKKNIKEKINLALQYSRSKRFIIEEFVEQQGYQIAGDGFSVNGKLVFRLYGNDHFNKNTKTPFVPVAASFPYCGNKKTIKKIDDEINRLFNLLNLKDGAYNFDIKIGKDGRVYLMEVGPRNGGNMIPQIIEYATGVNMIEYTIKAAMGEDCTDLKMKNSNGYYAYYAIHSNKSGILKKILINDEFEKNHILEKHFNYEIGDSVLEYENSGGTVGILLLQFKNQKEMIYTIENMNQFVKLKID